MNTEMKAGNASRGNHKRTKIDLIHFTMKVLQSQIYTRKQNVFARRVSVREGKIIWGCHSCTTIYLIPKNCTL